MLNQPGPVRPVHQQVASTRSEVQEIDFEPEPELFDVDTVTQEIRDAVNPK